MHLINCLHPVKIERNGVIDYVPCGTCEYCRFVRNTSMSERIRLEMQSHKYCIFFTLTYADLFLPKMLYNDDLKGFYVPDDDLDTISSNCHEHGLFFYYPWLDKRTRRYMSLKMKQDGFIPRLSRGDVQNFVKRFRRYIDYHFCKGLSKYEKQKFQVLYAICGEYGPSVYRPHMHGVFMFDSPIIAKHIKEILHSSWSFGSSSYRWSSDANSGRYVAQYINCDADLPSCFKFRDVRPFLLVSKTHPLGFGKINEAAVQKVVDTCSPTISLFDDHKGCDIELPLFNALEHRLFPQFSGYRYLPTYVRHRLVKLAIAFPTYERFLYNCQGRLEDYSNSLLNDYFSVKIKHHETRASKTTIDSDVTPRVVLDSALYSLYLAAKRIEKNCIKYGVSSLDKYLDKIDTYIDNKEKYQLALQMDFENNYLSKHPSEFTYLDKFNLCAEKFQTFDVVNTLNMITDNRLHQHKNKRKNEYLAKHPEYSYLRKYDEFSQGLVGLIDEDFIY